MPVDNKAHHMSHIGSGLYTPERKIHRKKIREPEIFKQLSSQSISSIERVRERRRGTEKGKGGQREGCFVLFQIFIFRQRN